MPMMGDLFATLLRSSLVVHFILTSATSAQVVLPNPSGPYAVTHSTLKLTDESRIDTLDPHHGKRQIMISSFYPIPSSACEQTCAIPYVSSNIAPSIDATFTPIGLPSGALEKIQFHVCCKTTGQEDKDVSKTPLAFVLHGFSGTRLFHNALAQELASVGFAVITMDHTFESAAVEFPDGSVVPVLENPPWNTSIPETLYPLQDIRADDVRFVLSELEKKDVAAQLVPGASSGFNISHTAILGHSFGGSTAINMLMKDSRFVGGLNLDGTQFGNITDIQQPVVLYGTTGTTPFPHSSANDSTWAETLEHSKGWKAEIGVNNVSHFGFCDIPYLHKQGALDLSDEALWLLTGVMDGGRSFKIISTYVTAFLDFVLRRGNTTLFDGPSEEFPEMVVY